LDVPLRFEDAPRALAPPRLDEERLLDAVRLRDLLFEPPRALPRPEVPRVRLFPPPFDEPRLPPPPDPFRD